MGRHYPTRKRHGKCHGEAEDRSQKDTRPQMGLKTTYNLKCQEIIKLNQNELTKNLPGINKKSSQTRNNQRQYSLFHAPIWQHAHEQWDKIKTYMNGCQFPNSKLNLGKEYKKRRFHKHWEKIKRSNLISTGKNGKRRSHKHWEYSKSFQAWVVRPSSGTTW